MKKTIAMVLALIMLLTLVGCANGSSSGGEAGTPVPQREVESDATKDEGQWGKGLKIGVAACHWTNAWNITNAEDIIAAFEAVGCEVVWNEAKNDTATQIVNVENLLAQDIDLLVIKPKEEEGLIPAFQECKDAGVPIICVDRKVSDSSLYATAIITDNVAGGEMVGNWIVEQFPEGARIVEITGTAGSTGQIERSRGLYNVLDQYTSYQILATQSADNMRSEAQTVAENLLQTYGKDGIDVIVTQNDEMAMGILQALDGMGVKPGVDIVVCSIGDANMEGVSEVAAGRIGCFYESTPYLGAQCVDVARKILIDKVAVDSYIPSANRFITAENAEEMLKVITW